MKATMYYDYPLPFETINSMKKNTAVYFDFEADFVEDNVRCIPMIVRFKLDACGIKLKLQEWSRMNVQEREMLAEKACSTTDEIMYYRSYLKTLVFRCTGKEATSLAVDTHPAWANKNELPLVLMEKLKEFNWKLLTAQWSELNNLQRFVLLKLCRPGHENKNFPKAMREFGLVRGQE